MWIFDGSLSYQYVVDVKNIGRNSCMNLEERKAFSRFSKKKFSLIFVFPSCSCQMYAYLTKIYFPNPGARLWTSAQQEKFFQVFWR